MTPHPARSLALRVSLGLVGAWWAYSAWRQLLSPAGNAPPPGVGVIAGYVAVKTLVAVAVVAALLKWNGETPGDLGLRASAVRPALGRGLAVAAGLFLLVNVGLGSVLRAAGLPGKGASLGPLFRDPREAPLWIFAGLVGGGFTEELLRAFVLTRFEKAFGRPGLVLALAADTAVFAFGHLYQGVSGAIQSGVLGLAFALTFLARRRATDAMATHAFFDLFGIAAAYVLYARR